MIKCLSYYKYVLLWTFVIVTLSLLPSKEFDNKQVDGLDLVIHFFFYGVFVLLASHANIKFSQVCSPLRSPLLIALSVAIVLGFVIELLQGTVFVSRTISLADFAANSVGAALATGLFRAVYGPINQYY